MLKRMKVYMQDRWMWLKSFFCKGLVKTGQSFTTDDATTLPGQGNLLLEMDEKLLEEQERLCSPNPDVCFKVIGAVCDQGSYKYRVYCPANRKVFDIDTELYELLFGNLKEGK